ncbi:PAS domain S-box protein [bacterium]|nr:PAS domain S-box protein [bacterium]
MTPPTGEASPPRHRHRSLADAFLNLLDLLDIAIWELDLEHRVVACNEKARSVYGDDIVGKHCYAITTGAQWVCHGCPVQQVYQNSRPSRSEQEHIDHAGRTIIVDHFATPVLTSDHRLTGVVVMLVDITERRRLDQEVLHQKTRKTETEWEKLIAAVQQTKDVVVITDRHGTIEFVNPAFTDVTGYSSKEAIGLNPRLLKSGKHDASFYRDLWQTIGSGRTFQGRMVNKKKDGTLYTEEATISPIFSPEGEIINYVGVKRDISEQLLLERQLHQAQKMEAIGRLTGGVAHDFNNILGVIIGYTDMALAKISPAEPLHKELSTVLDAAERSATIVRQLLAFARRQTIAPVALDLNETVGGMLKMLQRLIGENIGLSWFPAAELPPVMMDPVQVDQILANLVLNAKDSMVDHGNITIETSLIYFDKSYCVRHAGFQEGTFVMLAVSDDGCGIPAEHVEKIFEPFFTTKGQGRGTGLGLSTVYGIVKQNNGFINVYSETGDGTTFKLYFPAQPAGSSSNPVKSQNLPTVTGNETILLVEDDQGVREMTTMMLTRLGYQIVPAATPTEAINLVEHSSPSIDLLLTDVVMPGMNGKELAGLLARRLPNLKILFMSGYTPNVVAHKGVLSENINFIQKPFSRTDMGRKLRQVLDN